MAKPTTKKSNFKSVKQLAKKEIDKVANQRKPICFQIGNTVILGKCKIIEKDNVWKVTYDDYIIELNARADAIAYAVAIHTRLPHIALQIKQLSTQIMALKFDLDLFTLRLKTACGNKDDWKISHYETRIFETKLLFNQQKTKLKNISLVQIRKLELA